MGITEMFLGSKEDQTMVEISLSRYSELVKKEALFDLYMRDKEFNVYVFQRLEEKENA